MTRAVKIRVGLVFAAFAVGVVGAILYVREPMTPLTRPGLQAARHRWQAAGIKTYHTRFLMHGTLYDVQVSEGIVHAVTIDGRTPQAGSWKAYSVNGLFDTLEAELENLDDPEGPFAGRAESVLMRVRFHPHYGYPERYLRSAGGYGRDAAIEVLDFTPLDSASAPTPPHP
jgi:hypothetical protein